MSTSSMTINGITITTQDAAKFAPIVCAYHTEPYRPCTIEYLLGGSTWWRVPAGADGTPDWAAPGTQLDVPAPTPGALAALPDHGSNVKVQISADRYPGEGWTAPMNVCPQVPADRSYVDLTYIFLYCYNGAQCAQLLAPVQASCVVTSYAEHEGDIESVTVRVDPGLNVVQAVRYEQHGTSTWYTPDAVRFDAGGRRPYVGCALNSHASYNLAGRSGTYAVPLVNLGPAGLVVGIVDFIQTDGPQWNPSGFILVGIENGSPLGSETWAGFAGRLGGFRVNGLGSVTGADGPLSTAQRFWATAVAKVAALAHVIPAEDLTGIGPSGLYGRPFMDVAAPIPGGPGS